MAQVSAKELKIEAWQAKQNKLQIKDLETDFLKIALKLPEKKQKEQLENLKKKCLTVIQNGNLEDTYNAMVAAGSISDFLSLASAPSNQE